MAAMNRHVVLVTGANGFVGRVLCTEMRERGIDFLPVTRTCMPSTRDLGIVKNIHPSTNWHADLKTVDVVAHLAGRVHMVRDSSPDPMREYRLANVDATLNLAAQAAAAGVRRFIYLSSVKVNGEANTTRPFSEADAPAPVDPYGISKYEAEQGLRMLSQKTGLEVVVIRPPLVYGPRVKANFLQLMRWVCRGIPLPLASIDNRRSMIFVDNLVDVILRCMTHERASGRTFLVSDDHDVSIAELVRSLASAMERSAMLFPVPAGVLRLAANVVGKRAVAERLLNSLQVNIEEVKNILGWIPPYSFEKGIAETVRHFLETDHASRTT